MSFSFLYKQAGLSSFLGADLDTQEKNEARASVTKRRDIRQDITSPVVILVIPLSYFLLHSKSPKVILLLLLLKILPKKEVAIL